ncbi:MAG: FMN-binding negative transcriptional regulator [Schlesneria sp.]
MYVPSHFHEPDLKTLHDFIQQHSFGLLVSQMNGLPFATHIPFLLERESGEHGTLVGHTARANPQCALAKDQSVLAVFSGPHSYISPTWYESDNVVPTWNYVAVHAIGKLEIVEDQSNVLKIVQRMTDFYENSLPKPWSFNETTTFAERLLTQIVGFRIVIEKLEGKWKLSQNHPVERQEKVVAALRKQGDENSQAISKLMHDRFIRSGTTSVTE